MAKGKKNSTQLRNEAKTQLNNIANSSRIAFNNAHKTGWSFGDNWNNDMLPQFKNYINNYLFPKVVETLLINHTLGNKFNWLAEDIEFIGQISEEYVIKDSIPTSMDLSKNASLMLERNRPQMITKIYGAGDLRKLKFTLNNNDERQNWSTISDAVGWAMGVYIKQISNINLEEERTIKSMLIDYATNIMPIANQTHVNDEDELLEEIYNHFQYLQNNDDKFNEANLASNGAIGRYTTVSSIENLVILTSDKVKVKLLNTKIANTYNAQGLDITDHIMSFRDLGGSFRLDSDVTVNAEMLETMVAFGDYQTQVGDIIEEGTVFTYDIPAITDKTEIKPFNNDYFAFILDLNAIRYKRYTKGMLKAPFYNPEFDDVTYWLHYYSIKNISPFYNKAVIGNLIDGFYTTNPVYEDTSAIFSGKKTEQELLNYFNLTLGNIENLVPIDFKPELLKIANYNSIDWNNDSTTELVITYNNIPLTQYLGENGDIETIKVVVVKNYTYTPQSNIYTFNAVDGQPVPKQTLLTYFDCVLVKTVLGEPIPVDTDSSLFDISNYDTLNWELEGLQDLTMTYNGNPIEPYSFPCQIEGTIVLKQNEEDEK